MVGIHPPYYARYLHTLGTPSSQVYQPATRHSSTRCPGARRWSPGLNPEISYGDEAQRALPGPKSVMCGMS